jgi:hypothetical protein
MLHSLQIVQLLDLLLCPMKSLNTGPLSLELAVTIICLNLFRSLLIYFLQDCCHFYIHSICSETSKAIAFDFYNGVFVF